MPLSAKSPLCRCCLAGLLAAAPPLVAEIQVEAWYHLSDNAFPQDSSGFQRHLRIPLPGYSHASLDAAGGPLGKPGFISTAALEVGRDSISGYYDNGYTPPHDNVGIELWVKPFGRGGGSDKTTLNWIFSTGGNGGLNLAVEERDQQPVFTAGLVNRRYVGDPVPLAENGWTHLALVRDRGVATFYVDGIPRGAPVTDEPAPAGTVHLSVSAGGTGGFKGLIDEARIFTFAPGGFTPDDLLLRRPAGAKGSTTPEEAPHSNYQVKTWGGEDGLPHHSVTALAQTDDGYLWVGTRGGLARFDGRQFTVFSPGEVPLLDSGRIRSLAPGRDGALWIVTTEGSVVRHHGGKFQALPWNTSPAPVIARAIEDASGQLWLETAGGEIGRHHDRRFELTETGPARLECTPQGEAWIVGAAGIRAVNQAESVAGSGAGFLCAGRRGGYWQRDGDAVRLRRGGSDPAAGRPIPADLQVNQALEDRDGRLWLATPAGVIRKDLQGGDILLTTRDGLDSNEARVIFEDQGGGIWIGTEGGGLSRLNPPLVANFTPGQSRADGRIRALGTGGDGTLWVGTEKAGLFQYRHISSRPNRIQAETLASVHSLVLDPQGRLFAGSPETGLWQRSADHFERPTGVPAPEQPVNSLLLDSRGRLWIGPRHGRALGCLDSGAFHTLDFPAEIPATDVCAMAEDSAGGLWVGTDGHGLLRWHKGGWQRFGRAEGLGSEVVWSLRAGADGAIWIGTLGGGLSRWKNGRIATCTTRHGLHHDTITHVEPDGRGHFWCGSHQGIFRVRVRDLEEFADGLRTRVECVAYGLADGMASLECSGGYQPAGCRSADGRLWFPTLKGIAMINPSAIRPEPQAPPVRIEGISIDGAFRPGAGATAPAFDTSQRRYRFHYSSIDFTAPESLRFRTWLVGMDSGWVDAGPAVTTDYSQLDAGRYVFRVQAAGRDGLWSEPGAALAFEVRPRWWEQAAVRVTLMLAAIAAAGALAWRVTRARLRRRLAAFEQQRMLEVERRRIAANIHDDLGASLTRIALLSDLARDGARQGGVGEEIEQIRATADELTRSMDEVVWAVAPEHDTLESLASYLSRVCQDLLAPAGLRCRLSIPTALPEVELSGQVRHNLYLAVKEAIHNSIRHAAATEVRLDLEVGADLLTVTVMDNGRGFGPPAADGRRILGGHGVGNLDQRMREIGGRCEITSTPDEGTEIRFEVPLGQARVVVK
jgi:signal transduction histidine kinase/ligand-binding sensor domain-containing protein